MIIMDRDPDAKRNGFTSWSYLKVLEEDLLPNYSPGTYFQQDNAPIHNSNEVKEWLEEHGIWTLSWPPHSPDLNPIEHVWKKMKDILMRDFPGLSELTDNEANIVLFHRALRECWERVPQAFIDGLVESVPRRLAAVRKARGWYTKY